MIVYLDSNIVMYLVENRPLWGPRTAARIAALHAGGDVLAVSHLTRLECRVKPIKSGDAVLLADFDAFFNAPGLHVLSLTAGVCDRATDLRAKHNFKTPDALHLAAAIVHGCDRFLTNDARLNACTDIAVEVLP
jgi:predicted nucleic acid-binding protein